MQEDKLEFQILDWNSYHESDDENEEKYVIQLFGRTENDKDICLKISNFTPYFYVKLPDFFNTFYIEKLVEILKSKAKYLSGVKQDIDYDLSKGLIQHKVVQRYDFYYFNNRTPYKFLMFIFKSHTSYKTFSSLLNKKIKIGQREYKFKKYESNIEPYLRFMHINNLSSAGWVQIEKQKLIPIPEYSFCDLSYEVHWKDVKPSTEINKMAPFKIMGYDIECVSCDHNFPQAERETDEIIQIGITLYRYGETSPYEEHILTLKQCARIKNTFLYCYKKEADLLKGFAKIIQKLRPDIMAGYNNFGFDDYYIYSRIKRIDEAKARKKNVTLKFLNHRLMDYFLDNMSKVNYGYLEKNENVKKSLTSYRTVPLSSSAMGDNELKFFHVPGIVPIDMMKYIQRNYQLSSYKLDNVSAYFINEIIERIEVKKRGGDDNIVDIVSRQSDNLNVGSYIQIIVNDNYTQTSIREGSKFQVLQIEDVDGKKVIRIKLKDLDLTNLEEAMNNKFFKVIWTFSKDDMHHTLINKYYSENNVKKIRLVAKYCLKDCQLVAILLAKLEIVVSVMSMARVCHVPFYYLFLRGQGIKIFSLVAKKARLEGYLIPALKKEEGDDSYEGAIVISPVPGIYRDPINVMDYNSLYPNSIRQKCLSHECYVRDDKYLNLQDYLYHTVMIRDKTGASDDETHTYAQKIMTDAEVEIEMKDIFADIRRETSENIKKIEEETVLTEKYIKILEKIDPENSLQCGEKMVEKYRKMLVENEKKIEASKIRETKEKNYNIIDGKIVKYGILPAILTELLNKRKETNAQLAQEKNPSVRSVLNSLQLAYKITANSLYGQTGSSFSPIRMIQIASCTTAIGRERLEDAKRIVETEFKGSKIIYGDSVTALTPVIVKDRVNYQIDIIPICLLGNTWLPYEKFKEGDKTSHAREQSLPDCQIWTSEGWSNIQRVIRHVVHKKIYRVYTTTSYIEVTEDHSLLTDKMSEIKPSECPIGLKFLQGFPSVSLKKGKLDIYYLYGIFLQAGSLIPCWKICLPVQHIVEKCCEILEKIEKVETKVILQNDIYQIIVKDIIFREKYRELFYRSGNKFIPDFILNGNIGSQKNFIDGYCIFSEQIEGQRVLELQKFYYLLKNIGYDVKINYDGRENIVLIPQKGKIENRLLRIELLREAQEEVVYDVETTVGNFHAGLGDLIIKNTDSIFVKFHIPDVSDPEEKLKKSIALCKKAVTLINLNAPRPQCIVYEKTFYPFILEAKKRYIGYLYKEDPDKYSVAVMGMVLKRRDNAPIVKTILGGLIDIILRNGSISDTVQYLSKVINDLMQGKFHIDKFVITKSLRAQYKNPWTIAHKVLADRMALRDPGNKPQVNDRIPFVYIYDKNLYFKKDVLQGDLIETPDYVIKNHIEIDYLYYLEHQIRNPVTTVLKLMINEKEIDKIFEKFKIREDNRRNGKQSLVKWITVKEPEKMQYEEPNFIEKPDRKRRNAPLTNFMDLYSKEEC